MTNPQPSPFESLSVPREGESLSPRAYRPDYKIDPETGCWNWLKFRQRGYGRSNFTHENEQWAHRAYWVRANGPIPAAHDIHHVCKNPGCVNPAHLELISERQHDIESFLTDRANGLTFADIREIRRLGTIAGVTSKEVAAQFGISWRAVDDYWSGARRWADEFPGAVRPVRDCVNCGGPIPPEKLRHAKFCGELCRKRWNGRRTWRRAHGLNLDTGERLEARHG